MKKTLASIGAAAVFLFSACAKLPASTNTQPEVTTLVLALPEDASTHLAETARELARRGEDFSQNTLAFEIRYVGDIQEEMQAGTAHIYLAENREVAQTWGKLAFLELPYLFYDADYMISGVNAPEFLQSLNQVAGLPVQLHRVAFGGYIDLAGTVPESKEEKSAAQEETLRLAVEQPYLGQSAQEELEYEQVTPEFGDTPVEAVNGGQADLGEVQAADVLDSLGEKKVFFTQHRMVLVDIFFSNEISQQLTEKQQAILEEAAVYAAGYCKTMANQEREEAVKKAQEMEAAGRTPNINNLFSRFGDLYNSQGKRASTVYDKDLAKLLRQLAIRN